MSLVRFFDTLALDSWNPFGTIFGTTASSGTDVWLASDTTAFADTYIESRETAEAYVFSARLPAGVTKEEVKVEVEEDSKVLVIAGERCLRREAKSEARHHVERSVATFFGRFHLPEDAALGQVRAAMDDGGAQLTVTVPRVGAAVAAVTMPEPAVAIEVGEASPC
ncbi:17.9 kDa heat shock protein 2 [Aegilops tauschii subsp. strangulata]|uniref:SHSP domain-containing protein n=1 Tax=Aegilops tauschii subsp. strangulata TaxID=200361 RepID=A0A453DUA0_AEGTS|nr:17.9 kDa heat shock protein 2 [Aegilops tauschii subsp. strangulata]